MAEDDLPQPDQINGASHPRHTDRLFGQDPAQEEFLTAFKAGRLHHAWMITGPRGIGKATLAWRIARFLLAQPQNSDDMFTAPSPADLKIASDHPIARRVGALAEPRLFLCRRPSDEKTKKPRKNITVDAVRGLKNFFNFSAADGGWRVAIVDAADELNQQAANALLKILEEPPQKTVILLICHQPSALLPTIRSRCRNLCCNPLNSKDLITALQAAGHDAGSSSNALHILSDGSVGEAMRLQASDGVKQYAALTTLLADAPGIDRSQALQIAESCIGKSAEARYDMLLRLIAILLARLARFGALQPADLTEASTGEARLLARLAPNVAAGRKWASVSQDLSSRAAHARAVNLDPASVILDMFLKIDANARQ